MKKITEMLKKISSTISVVDKFLMFLMFILFIYIIIHMFICDGKTQADNTVYVIVRTSAASIFGYFISGNFASAGSNRQNQSSTGKAVQLSSASGISADDVSVKYQIGFSDTSKTEKLDTESVKQQNKTDTTYGCSKIQITVVAVIGIVSLVILMAVNISDSQSTEQTAMVSQLRDFISACIGFLISCGKTKE